MKQMYIADAFTTQLFGGNPAGVVLLGEGDPFPEDEVMRKTAAELRYSETAFIRPLSGAELEEYFRANAGQSGTSANSGQSGSDSPGGGDPAPGPEDISGGFQIRYFTPTDEVDLCGHATIASFWCLKDAGLCRAGGTYLNRTLAGDLFIDVAEDQVLMDMASPTHIADIREPEKLQELYEIMGVDWKDPGLVPQLISTGLPDIMMPVVSREELEAIDPDYPALTELSRRYEVTGVHAFTLATDGAEPTGAPEDNEATSATEGDRVTAYCRNFGPLVGIDEEAATGTANGALTYYLIRNGLAEGGGCRFIQGEKMGRPSEIRSRFREDESGVTIRVGGSAAILVKGEIDI